MRDTPARFFVVAVNPAIDFANTIVDPEGHPDGALRTWSDVIAFLEMTGGPQATRNPRNRTAFAIALKLRDDLREILAALASGGRIPPKPVESINRVLALRAGYSKLSLDMRGWELTHVQRSKSAAEILFPIAEAAVAIVTGGPKAGIYKCCNPECALFFQDKTGRRRWCSMAVCGNRAKVAAFARRNNN